MSGKYVGAIVRRREDPRLLTGRGRYVDDLRVAGCLHAVILRSPHAHARIVAIRTDRVRAHPAVVACFVHDDLASALRPLPIAGVPPPALQERVGFRVKTAAQLPLASGKVRYVGEPVAVVVATDGYAAEDALELVDVDYEPLPAVTDVEQGLAPGAPLIHEAWGDNVSVAFEARVGDPDRALAGAAARVRARIRVPRYAGVPLEPRGVLAEPRRAATGSPCGRRPRCRTGSGAPSAKRSACRPLRLRVVAPDVGGGFGTKCSIYPEDVLIPVRLGPARPARQVDRDPPRASPERDPLAGAAARRGARRHARTAASSRSGTGSSSTRAPTIRGGSSSRTTRSATCWARTGFPRRRSRCARW